MKIRNFLFGMAVSAAALTSCVDNAENLGTPNIELSTSEMTFEVTGGEQTVSVTASRDWTAEADVDWIVVNPESDEASPNATEVTVTVLPNTGLDREADVTFSIGMVTKTLTVSQSGEKGSADDLIVYSNNFDKTDASKSDDGWKTYLDSFDGWMNATGTGIADVTYGFDRMTARTNSGNGSAGTYSDYAGSGRNYLWFGSGTPYFAVKNITLPAGKRDFTLSFGTERYEYNAEDNTFSFDEFKVYVSADAKKWVKPEFTWAAGAAPNGRWDLASSTFTVPEGTEALSVYFTASVGSSYALDDLSLVESDAAGTALDFTNGEEFEIGDNTTSGGGSDDVPEGTGDGTEASPYSAAKAYNVASALGADDKVTGVYVQGIVKNVKEVSTQFGNATYWISDEDGAVEFYVYRGKYVDNTAFTSEDQIKTGDKVVVYGDLMNYMGDSPQLGQGNYIVSINGDGGSETPAPEPVGKTDIAGVISAADGAAVETEGLVVASYTRGILLKDDTGYLLVYDGTKAGAAVGDKVNVTGSKTTYAGLAQIGSPEITVLSSDNEVAHPSPTVLDGAALDAQLNATSVSYIEYTGVLTVSGNYYNVAVDGASTAVGSLSYPAESLGLADMNGKEIKVTGYYLGVSGTKYINTMVTAVEATGNEATGGDDNTGAGDNTGGDAEASVALTFPDGNATAVGSYTDVWEATVGGYTWALENFNNNNNAWSYVKCGRKSDASVASIYNKTVIAGKVSKVTVTIDKVLDASKVNSATLIVAADAEFTDVKETVSVSVAAGALEYVVSSPIENGYYKLVYDMASHGSKNGIIQISKVAYTISE